jgi:hypothetical protein
VSLEHDEDDAPTLVRVESIPEREAPPAVLDTRPPPTPAGCFWDGEQWVSLIQF